MAGPTVEELLRAGGQRRKPPPQEQVGGAETFVNRAVGMIPGANRLTDAISALALEAGSSGGVRATLTPEARAELQAMGEDAPEDPGLVDRYREVRDRRAERTELGSQQNPWAGRAGALTGFGLSLFAPLPKASGTGLGAAVKTGAGYGAFQGLTEGGADLTRGEFGEAALDTLKGAGVGVGLGAGLHGAMRLGQRGVQALRGARQEVLAQETAAAQEAAQKGQDELAAEVGKHRELVGKARGMMDKDFAKREAQQGQALEMNKAKDARALRSQERAQRAVERARRREALPEDPNTVVLEGMSGKAHQAQQTRSDKALQYRREMGEPDLSTKVASAREDYIQRMPEALDDPAAARRLFIERYLKQRYPTEPERVERLMRERIGPGGEVLPRPPPQPAAAAEEATRLGDAFDAAARGEARAGGGGSAWAAYGSDGKTIRALPEDLPGGAAPAARQMPSPLAPPPAIREGTGMPYGRNLRPELPPPEPTTQLATQSMAAPRDAPVTPVSTTRTAAAPAVPPPVEVPTVPGRPALPAGAPQPAAPPPAPSAPASDIQDVTRLAGPGDVAPLAAERAALREQGGLGTLLKETAKGSAAGGDIGLKIGAMLGQPGKGAGIGALIGGGKALTTTMLKDPAVRARVLAWSRLHVLARINPALYARVGAQLQSAGPRHRAAEHLLARKDPEYREAREKAAEQVAAMTDQQLVELFSQAN